MSSVKEKKIQGLQNTINTIAKQRDDLRKEVTRLKKELHIFNEEGFVEEPSLPLLIYDFTSSPVCEKHGATIAYEFGIYRCEACKTALQLKLPAVVQR